MSSNDIAIRVEGLGKRYQLGQSVDLTRNFREALMGLPRKLRKMIAHRSPAAPVNGQTHGAPAAIPADPPDPETPPGTFWALRDVNFEIKRGEVVGIIGRNGAGKSTLLKLLSRITWPTTGRAELRGRLASLLEVGTGFHPELTGRENIYLNGAILGMRKYEIASKFDEIVDFAEIERFLDTPVKRYSSGMYVRLAFAVAAHLEPEILIVDEVLAVGDAAFQRKCLGRMNDVAKGGRTVLFVSHNLSAVTSLCTRGIYLQHGRVSDNGPTGEVVRGYMADTQSMISDKPLLQRKDRQGSGVLRFSRFYVEDEQGREVAAVHSGGNFVFVMELDGIGLEQTPLRDIVCSVGMQIAEGNSFVMLLRTSFEGENLTIEPGQRTVRCRVNDLPLAAGQYGVVLYLAQGEHHVVDAISQAATLIVESGDYYGTGSPGLPQVCQMLTRATWSAN